MEITINKAQGKLKNVNLRTENNGEERVLSMDIKIEASVEAGSVKPLFAQAPDVVDALYDESNNALHSDFEFTHRLPIENIELTIDDLATIKGARIKKGTKLIPRNGRRFDVVMTIQVSGIGDVRPFAKRLHEEVKLTIIERQQSLPGIAAAA